MEETITQLSTSPFMFLAPLMNRESLISILLLILFWAPPTPDGNSCWIFLCVHAKAAYFVDCFLT